MPPKGRRDNKGRVLRTGESQRKDGIYQYRYTDPVTNKRRSVYSSSLNDLREKEAQISRELERGVRYHEGDITVAELMEYHLSLKNNLRKSTKVSYNTMLVMLSKYPLANMKIRDVKPSDCKAFAIAMQNDNYAYGTICSVAGICKEAFASAVNDDLLYKSPWRFKMKNVIKDDTVKKRALTVEETKNLLELVNTDKVSMRYKDVVIFLLETGMRIGEFCGLTVSDFDFENRIVSIERQMIRQSHKEMYLTKPKTTAGIRKIWLTDAAVESAQNLIANRNPNNIPEPVVNGVSGFLTLTTKGNAKCPDVYVQVFDKMEQRYLKHYGKEIVLTPHILRHTFATRASEAGLTIKTLVYLMGHTTARMTLDRYTDNSLEQTAKEMKQKCNSSLNARIR